MDHVLWLSDEDVKTLEGSNIYDKVLSLREDTDSAMDILWQVMQTEKNLELPSKEIWDEVLRAAYASILSRSFEDDSVDSSKLIPLLDMTQHSEDANVEHVTDAQKGAVIVIARRDLTSGEELYIEYSHDLELHEYASLYGFVPGEQKSYRELVQVKSPIFFP
ncbi:hypothetical protein MHU86_19011 [Fragilaria crotonensis]|nr:hypothetical protein MHU86_19011 [Fragilaria crotonensis]